MRSIVLSILAAGLLAGCATTEYAAVPQSEKEILTGSNIPRRDRSGSGTSVLGKEALEKVQSSGTSPAK